MASASCGRTEVIAGEQGWQPGRKTEHEMGESKDKSEPTSYLSAPPVKTVGDLQKKLGLLHHRAACAPGLGLTESQDLGSWECCRSDSCPMPVR